MLGITTADAIALGTLISGFVAILYGAKAGDRSKRDVPQEASYALMGGALVDRTTLRSLTEEVGRLADAVEHGVEKRQQESQDKFSDRIDGLLAMLERQHADRPQQRGR